MSYSNDNVQSIIFFHSDGVRLACRGICPCLRVCRIFGRSITFWNGIVYRKLRIFKKKLKVSNFIHYRNLKTKIYKKWWMNYIIWNIIHAFEKIGFLFITSKFLEFRKKLSPMKAISIILLTVVIQLQIVYSIMLYLNCFIISNVLTERSKKLTKCWPNWENCWSLNVMLDCFTSQLWCEFVNDWH